MTQVSDVARQVLSDVASDAGHILASQWVDEAYQELVTKVRYRHLRRVGELTQPATISAGTISVTQGSRAVTPDATALAAWNAVPQGAIVGRYLRVSDSEMYEIEQFANGELTLASSYAVVGGSGLGYQIIARYLTLAEDARWLGDFMHMRLWTPLRNLPLAQLDYEAPARSWAQGVPAVWCEIGVKTLQGPRVIEVYPYPAQDELLHYVYWSFPRTLGFDDDIPRVIPDYVLKEGALVNAMRYEMSKALRLGQMEIAATWRNEYRAQQTSWKAAMADAARADRGVDDVTFIVTDFGSRYGNRGYIRTAHDQVSQTAWW